MNYQFSTEKAKEANKSANGRRINQPGIHEPLELTEITTDKSKSGKFYIEFRVENEEGDYQPQRIWEPNVDNPLQREGESKEEAVQREIHEKILHLTHIMECFLPTDKAVVVASNFQEFCEVVKAKLTKVIKGVKLRVKLLLNADKEYVEFPRFVPYMEKVVEGTETSLYISEWEQKNRMEKVSAPKSNSPIINPKESKKTDDLPF